MGNDGGDGGENLIDGGSSSSGVPSDDGSDGGSGCVGGGEIIIDVCGGVGDGEEKPLTLHGSTVTKKKKKICNVSKVTLSSCIQ